MGYNRDRKPPTVLVLGGYGFIGRYVIDALKRHPTKAIIGTRDLRNTADAATSVRLVRLQQCLTPVSWGKTLSGVDVVINTVGILREREGETYEAVHHLAVGALAKACKQHSIPLVHVSALGIDGPVRNDYSVSKLRGENAIINSGCVGAVVRASVVDAPDGYGSGWFHRLAQWPIWLMPAHATRLLSPVKATDLGEALTLLAIRLAEKNEQKPTVGPAEMIEVGCGEVFTLEEYLRKLRNNRRPCPREPLVTLRIPEKAAKACADIFDRLNLTPYSSGHHELLKFDNIPHTNQLPAILGRKPGPIGLDIKDAGFHPGPVTSIINRGV